jgi:hypothetical protein
MPYGPAGLADTSEAGVTLFHIDRTHDAKPEGWFVGQPMFRDCEGRLRASDGQRVFPAEEVL